MSLAMDWTKPTDLAEQVSRYWTQGRILAAKIGGSPLFPLQLRLRRPDTKALGQQFEEVRAWIRELEDGSRARRGFGYDIEWIDINHRQLGRNQIPDGISVSTEVDALLGDPSKARTKLGWRHNTTFDKLVQEMVQADMAAARIR